MPMSASTATALAQKYMGDWDMHRVEIEKIDRWYRGKLKLEDKPSIPHKHSPEYRELRDRSMTHWLGLVVTATAQSLYVDGYRSANSPDNLGAWQAWQFNGLDSRQTAVHRGALAHGLSYVTILPGKRGDVPLPVIRGASARKMMALYADMEDDWPLYAIQNVGTVRSPKGVKTERLKLYDAEAVYIFDRPENGNLSILEVEEHGVGQCPVVQFSNMRDLDGRTLGEVEPYIDMAARIDQDTFDRLVVQRFGAWLVRWIAGMDLSATAEDPDNPDPETIRAQKIKLSIEDILVAEDPDTKFGTFPGSSLAGYIEARDADIRDLAAVTQTPPHHLLGHVANLSAEALAAAEAGLTRKVEERKHSFGESWEQVLRTAALLMGDMTGAVDFAAQVQWRDMESRSLAQAADALGKIATMLGVPPQALWEKIPGVNQTDVERWKQMVEEGDPFAGLIQQMSGAIEPVADDGPVDG